MRPGGRPRFTASWKGRAVGKWTALLDDEIPDTPSQGTDKTVEKGVLSVLAGTDEGVLENSRPSFESANDPAPLVAAALDPARACTTCQNLGPRRTCFEPIRAGLIPAGQGFGLAWPEPAHAANCEAFNAKTCEPAQGGTYSLTKAGADAAHSEPWDDAAISRSQGRVQRLMRLGLIEQDAESMAERLHLRDLDGDERRSCVECAHYRPGRCGNHHGAGLRAPEVGRDWAARLQRCMGFKP